MALRVPKAELTGLSESMIKRFGRKMLGEVPEPVEVMWHNRKVVKTALNSNVAARSNTALGSESQGFSAACEIPLAGRPENCGVASTA
jgi:hypothetical protein